ncbi:MAG: phosphate signaling complex protein PhoU [Bacteroidales bacterium]
MKYIEQELLHLKSKVLDMWTMTESQLTKVGAALMTQDEDLAKEVIMRERIINGTELKIDSECENIIALYAPVAIDLRFVLAMLKISNDLERIADFCEGIAQYVLKNKGELINRPLLQEIRLEEMIRIVSNMLSTGRMALEEESSMDAIRVFEMDDQVDQINSDALQIIARNIEENPETSKQGLLLYATVRRLERLGDHCTNLVEELIFYLDAKVLKHKDKAE